MMNTNIKSMELNDNVLEEVIGGKGYYNARWKIVRKKQIINFFYWLLFDDDKKKKKKDEKAEFDSSEYYDEYDDEYYDEYEY